MWPKMTKCAPLMIVVFGTLGNWHQARNLSSPDFAGHYSLPVKFIL